MELVSFFSWPFSRNILYWSGVRIVFVPDALVVNCVIDTSTHMVQNGSVAKKSGPKNNSLNS